jgi:hypothetical protein
MAISIVLSCGNVADVAVKIEALRISKFRIRNSRRLGGPVWRDEPSEAVGVVASAEVIEAGFWIAFFAGTTGSDASIVAAGTYPQREFGVNFTRTLVQAPRGKLKPLTRVVGYV